MYVCAAHVSVALLIAICGMYVQDMPAAPSSPSAGAASQGTPSVPPSTAEGGLPDPSQTAYQQQWAPEPVESEEEEEENVGQWSPEPLDPKLVGNQDVIHEDDDMRMLALLRAQVTVMASFACLSAMKRCTCATLQTISEDWDAATSSDLQ